MQPSTTTPGSHPAISAAVSYNGGDRTLWTLAALLDQETPLGRLMPVLTAWLVAWAAGFRRGLAASPGPLQSRPR